MLWVENGSLTPEEITAFAAQVEEGADAIRAYLGENLDIPGGNACKVEFYIATNAPAPKTAGVHEPWMFIPSRMVRRGNAPYLHEMVHVMAQWSWRSSEWAGEGFADHVAAAVLPRINGYHRSRILPNGLDDLHRHLDSEPGRAMFPLIGVAGRRESYAAGHEPVFRLTLDQRATYAPPFYSFAWSFTDFLIARYGVGGFRRIATAGDQDVVAHELAGVPMAALRQEWLDAIGVGRNQTVQDGLDTSAHGSRLH